MSDREPMPIDRTKPVIRWVIFTAEAEGAAQLIEVEDVMRCIAKPGDYGWVDPTDKESGIRRWIADFEQVFPSRHDAKIAWIMELKRRIAVATRQLEEAQLL